jgi:hypothetical protein
MGIPFPSTLGAAANALAQTMPVQVPMPRPTPAPTPAPTASSSGSGAGASADGGLDSLPRDRTRERERPCKCPPEKGARLKRNHSMNPDPRRYQARVTGYEYGIATDEKNRETTQGWNMEWIWHAPGEPEEIDFDGFVKAQCLLQEAKGNYDQFLDANDQPKFFFRGFDEMARTIRKHGRVIRNNPPTKLMWYFQTERTRDHMFDVLNMSGVPSVHRP